MNFNRKSNENYISSKSGDFAQQGLCAAGDAKSANELKGKLTERELKKVGLFQK